MSMVVFWVVTPCWPRADNPLGLVVITLYIVFLNYVPQMTGASGCQYESKRPNERRSGNASVKKVQKIEVQGYNVPTSLEFEVIVWGRICLLHILQ
jgi:hypothetical protein